MPPNSPLSPSQQRAGEIEKRGGTEAGLGVTKNFLEETKRNSLFQLQRAFNIPSAFMSDLKKQLLGTKEKPTTARFLPQELAKNTVAFGKSALKESAKLPIRLGMSLVDVPRVFDKQEPLKPINVPLLGKVESHQRTALNTAEQIRAGEKPVISSLKPFLTVPLDVISFATAVKGIIKAGQAIKGGISALASKGTQTTIIKNQIEMVKSQTIANLVTKDIGANEVAKTVQGLNLSGLTLDQATQKILSVIPKSVKNVGQIITNTNNYNAYAKMIVKEIATDPDLAGVSLAKPALEFAKRVIK